MLKLKVVTLKTFIDHDPALLIFLALCVNLKDSYLYRLTKCFMFQAHNQQLSFLSRFEECCHSTMPLLVFSV